MQLNPVSVDLSKSVFQLSIADERHHIKQRLRLSRPQFERWLHTHEPVHLVMESCATSNYWGRTARALGHAPKLIHPAYVKPYVRRNKTDAADADALIRADLDEQICPVPVKSEHQQALQGAHRIRQQWVGARTSRICEVRSLLAEYGVSLPAGAANIEARLRKHLNDVPPLLGVLLESLVEEIATLAERVKSLDATLKKLAKEEPAAQRLMSMPGVAHITATALIGRVADIHSFRRARSFASWLGLTPKEHSSGNKRRLGAISRAGDPYLRTLLIHGARSALLAAARKANNRKPLTRLESWALRKQAEIGHNRATVALANKMARITWVLWTREQTYTTKAAKSV